MEQVAVMTKTKWKLDVSHSAIEFKVRHLMISNVKGSFKRFEATVFTVGEDFLTADIECWIDASSVSTGDLKRDEHLVGVDFFDTKNFNQIIFRSHSLEAVDSGSNYQVYGDLTIKGITQKLMLQVEYTGIAKDPWGNEKAGFSISGKINRKEWGLNWNAAIEAGGVMVSDEVKISCDVELTKQP